MSPDTTFDWDQQLQASRAWQQHLLELGAEQYLELLQSTGWFQAVGEARTRQLREQLRHALAENPTYCFYELADTEFDADCIEEAGTDDSCSYYSIILQLAHDSRSLFRPESVSDALDRERGIARVSFEHQGTTYDCEVLLHDEWFQDPVLQLVNRALSDSGVEHRFIDLPPCNATRSLALVPPSVFKKTVDLKLVPDVRFYAAVALEDQLGE